jgi:hypothetical protein
MSFVPECFRLIALATLTLYALVSRLTVISRGKRKCDWIACRPAESDIEEPRTLLATQGYDGLALRRMRQPS